MNASKQLENAYTHICQTRFYYYKCAN